ncbi:MAG: hypothetical protein ACE5I3_14295 [Phycisphaerae bacterium]
MRLESGPAAYDRNYYLIFLLVCVALGTYFCYDYAAGYPNKNREHAQTGLTLLFGADKVPAELAETPTKSMFDDLAKTRPTSPDAVREKLGQPFETIQAGSETVEYFVSAYGMGTVPIVRGQVDPKRMRWETWYKSKDEIQFQLYFALVAFAIGLYVLYRVYKAATLRVAIDDGGMVYAGRRIPFDNMTRLCDYSRKGWVDLYYRHGQGQRKLRIDKQKVRKFGEIIDTLCEATGFEDPRQAVEPPEATKETDTAVESTEPADAAPKSADDAGDEAGAK